MLKGWFSSQSAPPREGEPPQEAKERKSRSYEVGWLFANETSSAIWGTPQPVAREPSQSLSSKSVGVCPAVVEFDRRHFVIPCPIDVHMRLTTDSKGQLSVKNMLGDGGPVRPGTLARMMVFMPHEEWRHPQRPVVQIATPYLFVSDDPVYINQFPPFLDYGGAPRPGIQLCGRFPIDVWPRVMMWAFEWHDMSKDLILKRGEPWFYVRFEGPDPSAPTRLIEAEMTPDLATYTASITDVTNYVSRTFSLFNTARSRRPEKLLVPKRR
jgi:hypothetical protein